MGQNDPPGDGSATALAARNPGDFAVGDDPRRWHGGSLPRDLFAVREALKVHLPTASKLLGEMLADPDRWVQLAAVKEIYDRTIGKPKPVDENSQIRQQMNAIFAIMRTKLTETEYGSFLDAMEEVAQK